MLRDLLLHDGSDALFEIVSHTRAQHDKEVDRCCWAGCDVVSGNMRFEIQYQMEKLMEENEVTIRETFTRDQFLGKHNPEGNDFLAARVIFGRLRARGVPVIGALGVLGVEWGKLTIEHEDGLDGDEWHYTWIGRPLTKEWIAVITKPGHCVKINEPLAVRIAEAAKVAAAKSSVEDDEL